MSLIFATQLTAVFTAILGVGAIFTAVFAVLAFKKQSKEVRDQAEMLGVQSGQLELQRRQLEEQQKTTAKQAEVLELQAAELRESLDERKRQADDSRRAQASLVYMWEYRSADDPGRRRNTPHEVLAHVNNTSAQPIYGLRFSWRTGDQPRQQTLWPEALMPGKETNDRQPVPAGTDPGSFGAVAIFRDRAGIWWRAHPDGRLDELPSGAEPPHSW